MYKTKKELDLHVEDTFSKVRGEHERATRCFTIAKQYASIKEFNSAIRYMEKYLTTNPSNSAEALKLIGDFYRESNSFDKALESYKSSYKARKTRETLIKICDLIEAGHGTQEDQGVGRQRWFDLQRVAPNLSDSPMPYQDTNSASFTNRPSISSGPPRTGFSKTLMLSSNISMNSPKSTSHINGSSPHEVSFSFSPKAFTSSPEREENPIRSLERRYDDTLAKILGTVQRIADDLNVLKERVEGISVTQKKLVESRAQSRKAEEAKSVNGNRDGENVSNVPPMTQPQQLPLMQPNHAFGYGVPFPSPYMHPFFMPDPTLSYLNNPMLAAAALYGNPMFGNPLAAAGGIPRNEAQQATINPTPAETSLLAGLLTKNQFMPPSAANSQIGDGLYPQNQLIQAQLAASANLGDKLWQAPQLIPTSVALGPKFSAAGTSTSNTNTSIINSFENSKNSPITSTPLKTPTNSTALKAEIAETPKSTSSSLPTAKKEVKGINLFPENVVVSNTEKVPTVSSSAFNSNVLSVTIPPEHRNAAPVYKPQEPKFDEKKKEEAANPFANISFAAPSFGDLAKSAASTGFTGFQSVNVFSGTGTPVFGNVIASQSAAGDAVVRQDRVDGEEVTDDFVPTAEFQPVIPLPPLVEVKKGNENENTLFEHRAKIYRFVKETKEWKERGVGNIMILQDKDNPRKIRVVMWRERVFKLACNHWITKDLVIENHQGSSKILKWTVLDFAEGDSDPKLEIFTCRFAQEDKCAEFKATMERMIAYLATQEDSSPEKKPQEKESVSVKPFADLFKKPAGSWGCTACYVDNAEKDPKCVACGTPKETKLCMGTERSLAELFKAPEGSWSCGGCYINNAKDVTACVACNTPKPGCQPQPDSTSSFKPESFPFTFGFGPLTVKAPTTESPSHENGEKCRGCDPDSFDFSQLDKQTMPLLPKDPIQKIPKASEKTPPSILSVPKFTPVMNALHEPLTPDTSPKKDKENSESSFDANSTKTGDEAPKFRFSLGADSNATLNTGFQLKTPSFSFTPTLTQSSESSTPSIFGGKMPATPFVFGNNSIFGGNLSSSAVTSTPVTAENKFSAHDVVVPSVVPQNSNTQLPTSSQPFKFGFFETTQNRAEDGNEEDDEESDDEDDDDDDDDNEECMFESDAQFAISETLDAFAQFDDLGEGQVRVIYDGEQFCARLLFMKNEECLIDHFIAAETTLKTTGDLTFEWVGINVTEEHAVKIKMRITFLDQQAYDAFSSTMAESTELAVKADVTEAFLLGEDGGSADES